MNRITRRSTINFQNIKQARYSKYSTEQFHVQWVAILEKKQIGFINNERKIDTETDYKQEIPQKHQNFFCQSVNSKIFGQMTKKFKFSQCFKKIIQQHEKDKQFLIQQQKTKRLRECKRNSIIKFNKNVQKITNDIQQKKKLSQQPQIQNKLSICPQQKKIQFQQQLIDNSVEKSLKKEKSKSIQLPKITKYELCQQTINSKHKKNSFDFETIQSIQDSNNSKIIIDKNQSKQREIQTQIKRIRNRNLSLHLQSLKNSHLQQQKCVQFQDLNSQQTYIKKKLIF